MYSNESGALRSNAWNMPSQPIHDLARQMLTIEAASQRAANAHPHEAVRVCEKLRVSLTRFAGAEGFASLLRRSVSLARAEIPSLSGLNTKPDCSLQGLEILAERDATGGVEVGATIIAHLLGLLVTFIGEPLMLRLVRESWPDVSLDDSHQEN